MQVIIFIYFLSNWFAVICTMQLCLLRQIAKLLLTLSFFLVKRGFSNYYVQLTEF